MSRHSTPHTDIVGSIQMDDSLRSEITLDANRNLRRQVKNYRTDTPETYAQYDYFHDLLDRRKAVDNSGTAFAAAGFNYYGYNGRSELESGRRYEGGFTVEPPTQTEVTARRRVYDYDNIGNRESYTEGTGAALHYCANNLNQYTATDDAAGCAAPVTESFKYYPDGSPELNDGNLLQDGTFKYTWDGENRLVRVEPAADPPPAGSKKVEFEYDWMGRRTMKQVYERIYGQWAPWPREQYVYDGWNVVLVLGDENEMIRKYTWGLDLSGQAGSPDAGGIHGAGGIGGLLWAEEPYGTHSGLYFFMYDANGNVTEVVKDGASPTLAAHYEYDPYGNVVRSIGAYADANPVRFSTKWWDGDTGAYYFGGRYLLPWLGRWANRDRLGEEAGPNLCAYASNRACNAIDPLGLKTLEELLADCGNNMGKAICKGMALARGWTELMADYACGCGAFPKLPWPPPQPPAPPPPPRECKWYLGHGNVAQNYTKCEQFCANTFGGHWQIVSSCDGVVLDGWFGRQQEPEPNWKKEPGYRYDPIHLMPFGELKWGPPGTKGVPCSKATHDQIAACLRNKPPPKGKYIAGWNDCQTDVKEGMNECCLSLLSYRAALE